MANDIERFQRGDLDFEELKSVFNSQYQPSAYALAERMLSYVPDDDPRIVVRARAGSERHISSDDLTTINHGLEQPTAVTHLRLIVEKLTELTQYLPAN